MKLFSTFILMFLGSLAIAQVPAKSFVIAQVFNKDEAVYEAKSFVASEVLGNSPTYLKFEIDALAATTGGELTTLFYNCTEKKEEGLVFMVTILIQRDKFIPVTPLNIFHLKKQRVSS